MYKQKRIALVIPAYREEKLISDTLAKVPPLFDHIFVVDDASPDRQGEVVEAIGKRDKRVHLLKHKKNKGPGAAIVTGYLAASEASCDISVVVGADDQMDLSECERFLDPIISGVADYTKGNRFFHKNINDTLSKMPKIRLFANWLITALTKIASGFYKTMDVVDGYTAISKQAIDTIDWSKAWPKYGYPMDFLVRLNAYGFKIKDIPRKAIYLPGVRQSQIRALRYFRTVAPMLLRDFFWRLKFRYMYRDFHPLVFFFFLGFVLIPAGFALGMYLVADWLFLGGLAVTGPRSILVALLLSTGIQLLLFAMWFDMQEGQ